MKYLVTGGTGFIGRAIVLSLLQKGHNVVILDNNFRGDVSQLDPSPNLQFIFGDIRDANAVVNACEGVDSIIHLAFINGTNNFYQKPDLVVDVGIRGMLNVAEAAKRHKVPEIILMSSSETYQFPTLIPTPEDIPLVIPDILNPRFSYGGAKIASELILVNYCSPFLNKWKIIRPHNVYGPNMGNGHVIPNLISKMQSNSEQISIQGDGTQTRSFCHISDFTHAFGLVLESHVPSGIYNIGIDHEITILELVKKLMSLMNKNLTIEFLDRNSGETPRRCPDITKIRNLGFQQKIDLETGLKTCLS